MSDIQDTLPPVSPVSEPVSPTPTPTPTVAPALVSPTVVSPTPPVSPTLAPADSMSDIQPLPRISIHAFCETDSVASVLDSVSQDRRMSKAHITVDRGGITSARDHYSKVTTPNLLIVEVTTTGDELLSHLGLLAQVCNDGTNVLVIGHNNDVQLYRELMSRGVSEYLVTPITMVDVMRALNMMFIASDVSPLGHSVAFIGARGGVGSSTLSHNVAFTISSKCDTDVVLMDMDLPFGTANIDFDQDPSQGISEAIQSSERIDDTYLDRLLVKCSDRLSLLAAPSTLLRECDFRPDEFQQVIEVALRGAPNVILDIPNVWMAWSRSTLLMADQVVIVATRDLACLRNTKNLLDYLREHRPNDKPPILVLNMDDMPKRPELPLDDFVGPLGLTPTVTIPFDAALFGQAMNNAQMISEVAPRSESSVSLEKLSNILIGRESNEVTKSKGFLGGLLKRS